MNLWRKIIFIREKFFYHRKPLVSTNFANLKKFSAVGKLPCPKKSLTAASKAIGNLPPLGSHPGKPPAPADLCPETFPSGKPPCPEKPPALADLFPETFPPEKPPCPEKPPDLADLFPETFPPGKLLGRRRTNSQAAARKIKLDFSSVAFGFFFPYLIKTPGSYQGDFNFPPRFPAAFSGTLFSEPRARPFPQAPNFSSACFGSAKSAARRYPPG